MKVPGYLALWIVVLLVCFFCAGSNWVVELAFVMVMRYLSPWRSTSTRTLDRLARQLGEQVSGRKRVPPSA